MIKEEVERKLISRGFSAKFVKTLPEDLIDKNIFEDWTNKVNSKQPITILTGDIDEMIKFAVCSAKLFVINKLTVECINSLHLEDGHIGYSFFVTLIDGFALNKKKHDIQIKRFITQSITKGFPRMLLFTEIKEFFDLLPDSFISSIENNILYLKLGGK